MTGARVGLNAFDMFAFHHCRVYLRRRKRPTWLGKGLSSHEVWLIFHDRKDAKRQSMDFSTWIILSRRKKRKYEPFV